MDFCPMTENLVRAYFSTSQAEILNVLEYMADGCVIIGTGSHEYFLDKSQFCQALSGELEERQNIAFQCRDFWCRQQSLGDDACLVYGGGRVFWESDDRRAAIDMDSRFSIIYQKFPCGWKAVHVHHSVPDREQSAGEYYPKSLVEQLRRSQEVAQEMARLSMRDGLTQLYNYSALERHWDGWKTGDCWLFLLDLDCFKTINDTHGHLAGNRVLQEVADMLLSLVRSGDAVYRIGGDEFVVLCRQVRSRDHAELVAQRLLHSAHERGTRMPYWSNISIGATDVIAHDTLESAVERADKALYQVKRSTKNNYLLCGASNPAV